MKTILIYLPNLNCGGAESVTVRLANFLVENNYSVKLITSVGDGILKESLSDKIEYIPLNLRSQWFVLFKMPFVIKKIKPDIIFTTMKESCFIMIISKYLSFSNAKVIIREANTLSLQLKEERKLHQKIKNHLIKISYKFADKIIALSEEIKLDIVKTFNVSKNISVIPNPINFDKIEKASKEPFGSISDLDTHLKLVTVARLYPQKNHIFMVEAISEYIKRYGIVTWYLVGDGPLHTEIKNKAESLGISKNIVFLGFQSNPISIVKACDIFVLPSVYEGFSNALLEAAALNKKIMVSDSQTTSVAFLRSLNTGTFYLNDNIDDFCVKLNSISSQDENDNISLLMKDIYSESTVFNSYMMLMRD